MTRCKTASIRYLWEQDTTNAGAQVQQHDETCIDGALMHVLFDAHDCRRFSIKYPPERGALLHMAQSMGRDNVEATSMCQLLVNLWPLLLGNVLAFWTARLDKRKGSHTRWG